VLLKEIKEKMELAAEDLRFEDAARYRDQLSSIEKIQEKQRMVTQRGDLDVLGIAVDTSMACVQLLFIRGGRLLGRAILWRYKLHSKGIIITYG